MGLESILCYLLFLKFCIQCTGLLFFYKHCPVNHYEVEIKVLLGTREEAEKLLSRMRSRDPSLSLIARERQLNHYFIGGGLDALATKVDRYITDDDRAKLHDIISRGRKHSVRTRYIIGGESILVVKSSVNDETSSNSTIRMECEIRFARMPEDKLDGILLASGFDFHAKWSRDRHEYQYLDMHVDIDRNAGYGYVVEFEKTVKDPEGLPEAKKSILDHIESLGYAELDQKKLADMFAYYNEHWREYYGTDRIFTL